jgi:hypothetical protein
MVLINRPKIPQMLKLRVDSCVVTVTTQESAHNLSIKTTLPNAPKFIHAQIVCPSPKVWDFDEKRLHWASVVRATVYYRQAISKFGFFTTS